jgi:beta-mannosidase
MKISFLCFLLSCCLHGWSANNDEKIKLAWELGYNKNSGNQPLKWVPANVPGAIQLDIARAEKYQPHYYAENWKDYLWMEDMYFTYRTVFKKPQLKDEARLYFTSLGIEYEFEIFLNNEKIFYQEGMFTPVNLDLTEKLKDENILLVRIFPVPKLHSSPADRTQASQSVKPAVSYIWDWHPRLIPVGIWDETYLEIQQKARVSDFQIDYNLNDELTKAEIDLYLEGRNLNGTRYSWSLRDNSGKEVLKSGSILRTNNENVKLTFSEPRLWWPHDHGIPYLYNSVFQLYDQSGKLIQTQNSKIGFRRVKLVMNEGGWIEPVLFPKTRSVPPVQFEINGRKIFCKGTNWVPPDIFPGVITRDRYEKLIDLAIEANFNILRVWGGGMVNKESFFELCDEKGLLVWQEFPLACNNYEGTPRYLSVLETESASIINRVKRHPSLALWCGGNELFNTWSRMTDQSAAIRLLNSQCFRLDPNTPFIPTSPVMGMGHGHYLFLDLETGEEVFQMMGRSKFTAYTEFGMPSPASVSILKKIIPENELWPPKPGASWESHHAYNAWQGNTWLCQDVIEHYFGKSDSLEELVANGQLLQGEGYKCIYEEARRQKPYCSIAANWCFNEPWPTAANNSIVSYPDIPKPGFHAVKNACRPVLASSRFSKFLWKEGEEFHAEIWMLNDLPKEVPAGKVVIKIKAGNEQITLLDWNYDLMNADNNQAGPTIRFKLPSWPADRFKLILEVDGHPEYNSEYTLAYRPAAKNKMVEH